MSVQVEIDGGAIQAMLRPGGEINSDIERRGQRVLAVSQVQAPVDFGRLRASGELVPSQEVEGGWDVVYPVDYAWYVDQGTRFMESRPFLSDAVRVAVE